MAYKEPVIKAKLHQSNVAMSNEEHATLNNPNQAMANAKATIERIERKQEEIDYYNSVTVNKIDPALSNVQLAGKSVIVRLHKENYIKGVSYYADNIPMYDAWISQVDGRMHQSQPAKWMDNPLPYVFSGVVVAISPAAKLDFVKEAQALSEASYSFADANLEAKALEVGDIVHLEHFMFPDKRFYLDKQARDFIKNPEEFRITHFEGYVKIHPSMIEGTVKDKTNFVYFSSPYLRHKAFVAGLKAEAKENNIN